MKLPINQIICGDCLEIMPNIIDGSIDMVMTDPPYGKTACKWDSIIPLEPMWKQLKRIIKPNGIIVIMASQPFTTSLIVSNMNMFKYDYIWLKERGQNFVLAKKQFMRAHETCLIFYNKQPTYNPNMTNAIKENIRQPQYHTAHKSVVYGMNKMPSKDYNPTKRYPLSYGLFKTGRARDKLHPTQKPVALMEYLIKTYTNEGEIVLDFATGSGTTCIAAERLGRRWIGIEIDENYCKIAREGIEKEKEKRKRGLFSN